MKRKNIKLVSSKTSAEESLNDEQQASEEEIVSEGEGGDSEADSEVLNASATDSDEDESDIGSDSENINKDTGLKISKSEKVKQSIFQRYQERQGKQLYIRFPHKVPETQESLEEKVKELTPLVIKVHKPRQRHVRFCLVDFATKEDRDTAFSKLKKSIKKGELKKYVVKIPRTESTDYVKELAEHKLKSIENKKAKYRLKKATKKALKENNFTSTVIVFNLPKTASVLQIRELFTNAVDINIKPGKGKLNKDKIIAAITFPTTMDARNAIKRKLSLGGDQLVIKFDNRTLKKKFKPKHNNDSKKLLINQEPKPKILKLQDAPEEKKLKKSPTLMKNLNKSKKVNKKAIKNKPKVAA